MPKPIPFPGAGPEPAGAVVEPILAAVPRIARICALGIGLEELLHEVCREIAGLTGAEACHLVAWTGSGAGPDVWFHTLAGSRREELCALYRQGSLWEKASSRLLEEGSVAVSDLGTLPPDDPLRALFGPLGSRGLLAAPLTFGTALVGMLSLHSGSVPRAWGRGEIRLVEEVRPILAASLERRRIEERLRASEARYRFLADNALDLISLHDTGGRYLYVSPAALKMLGYRPEEMTGCPASAFLHPDEAGPVAETNRRLVAGDPRAVTLAHRLRKKDGGYAEVETIASAVPDDRGEVRQVLRITRDVSERRRMEARLFESQKMETIGLLAGGMAHEFNNLLTGIGGAVEMLNLLLAGNAETTKFLEMIGRLGNRATVLTRQLLAYARRGKVIPEPAHLNKLVSEDVPVLKASFPASVDLRVDLGTDVPPVSVDVTQFKQVVTALCINGAEAMPEGGVLTIRTKGEPPEAAAPGSEGAPAPAGGRWAVLEVSDTGSGIDAATLARIFEPFFTTKFIGRGMGLAAVRGIVEAHGGEIRVRSRVGHGTTFTVTLPMARGDIRDAVVRDAPPVCGTGLILVADDEDDVRMVVRAMLESFGYNVVEARDGGEAVAVFRERRGEIDLVLLDLMMPRMTGEEAFAEIRRIDPRVRGLLASGYDESGRIGEIVAAGFQAFLQKPFRRRDLGQKVADALGRQERSALPPARDPWC